MATVEELTLWSRHFARLRIFKRQGDLIFFGIAGSKCFHILLLCCCLFVAVCIWAKAQPSTLVRDGQLKGVWLLFAFMSPVDRMRGRQHALLPVSLLLLLSLFTSLSAPCCIYSHNGFRSQESVANPAPPNLLFSDTHFKFDILSASLFK